MTVGTPWELVIIGIIALIIGIIGVIAGFGGGVFLVPSLILIFSVPANIAVGTVFVSLFLPAVIGAIGAWRRKEVNFRIGLLFAIPMTGGTIAGVFVVKRISDLAIVITIGILAFLLSVRMVVHAFQIANVENGKQDELEESPERKFWRKLFSIKPTLKIKNGEKTYELSIIIAFVVGVVFGVMSGLFGISAGWIQTPMLILAFGLLPLVAAGTSLFIIVIKTFAGGITHIVLGNVDWIIFAVLGTSLPVGALIGNFLKGKMRGKQVSLITGISLLLISVFIIISAFITR